MIDDSVWEKVREIEGPKVTKDIKLCDTRCSSFKKDQRRSAKGNRSGHNEGKCGFRENEVVYAGSTACHRRERLG